MEWDPLSQEFVHGLLLGYHVVYRRVERGYSHIWNTTVVGANDTGVTMWGLKKYGTYVIQVRAFNRKGDGQLTKGYMITTDEDGEEQGLVSRKSRKLFGPEKPFVKLRPAYPVKLVF